MRKKLFTSMKRSQIIHWLLLAAMVLLAACQPVQPEAELAAATPETTPEAAEETADSSAARAGENVYADPDGRFTVPIPTNWRAEQMEDYGLLQGPEGDISVYVMALQADDLESAIGQAWTRVDPDFDLAQEQVTEIPTTEVDSALSILYDTEDESQIAIGEGRLFEGVAYLMLVRGPLESAQRRGSQLQIIATGMDIQAMEETDLTGVEPDPITPEMLAELESYIETSLQEYNIPGAAVAVVQDDEIIYTQGFGERSSETGEPMEPDTRVMIGSTGKTFTTLLLAKLVDNGVIEWDTPVVDILPSFAVADPEITQRLTVQHLVCACTGVPRRDMEIFFNANELSAEDIIESLATFESFTDFGEAFQYSNQMVATSGYVAAAAANAEYGELYSAYQDLIQEFIFEPIGMPRTTMDFSEVLDDENHAEPHTLTLAGAYEPAPMNWERFVTPVAPAGAHWSTAEDMGRYLITELNRGVAPDGTRIVATEQLTHTWEPQVSITAQESYGLGWIIGDYKGKRIVSHGGNTVGFSSELAFLPEDDIGISIITNAYGTNPFNQSVLIRLLELVFDQEPQAQAAAAAGIEQIRQSRTSLAENMAEAVTPSRVEPYLGEYQNEALGTITLTLEEGRLLFDIGEFVAEVRPIRNEEGNVENYMLADTILGGTQVAFQENAQDAPVLIFGQGVTEYRFDRVEAAE